MKYMNKILKACFAAVILMTSCADDAPLTFEVTMPASLAEVEYLNSYDALKTYIDRTANPNFRLGAGTALADYTAKGVFYRLLTSNFDEITLGNEMKHNNIVQDDGSLNLANVVSLVTAAKEAGITVHGHTLVWHSQQRASYLNSLLLPTVIPGQGGPTLYPSDITNSTFETGTEGWNSWGNNSSRGRTEAGDGYNGGYALWFTNPSSVNSWEAQVAYDFSSALVVGDTYELNFRVKATTAGMVSANMQNPTSYAGCGDFGSFNMTTEWTEVTLQTVITGENARRFIFNFGNFAGTIYIDDITLCRVNSSGSIIMWVEQITNGDMEGQDMTTSFQWTNNSNMTFTETGEGAEGAGRAVKFTNESVQTNDWDCQFFLKFDNLVPGETYKLSMDVRSDENARITTQFHSTPTNYVSGGSIGAINTTPTWTKFESTFTAPASSTPVGSFAFNLGSYATSYYIDNVSFTKRVEESGDQIIEKTPEEKDEIITAELERWIKGLMDVSKDVVMSWDVVNEPMSDGPDPYQLKTGVGIATLPADAFYWQDFLGTDYAVKAIRFARQYGNQDDKLFINDYNLEYNLEKCKGLIEYVKYVDSKGVRVDGIGTQMHISLETNRDNIVEMFKLLAATGKLIKVTEFDLGIGTGITTPNTTDAQYLQQADYYRFVVEKYFELIPAAQRAGITLWSPLDSPDTNNAWRRNEPIGLWTRGYLRKHAYSGFANGLAGRDVSADK